MSFLGVKQLSKRLSLVDSIIFLFSLLYYRNEITFAFVVAIFNEHFFFVAHLAKDLVYSFRLFIPWVVLLMPLKVERLLI